MTSVHECYTSDGNELSQYRCSDEVTYLGILSKSHPKIDMYHIGVVFLKIHVYVITTKFIKFG